MIRATIIKDIRLLLRDRGRLISLLVMPLFFIVLLGSMFKFGADHGTPRSIAIWHGDGDPRGAAIERAVAATPGFATMPLPSAERVRDEVASGRAIAGLIVPAELDARTGTLIELAIDQGAQIQVIGPVQGALVSAVMRALAPPELANTPPPIAVRTPPGIKPPDHVTGFQVTVPGNAVLFGFFIAMAVAMSFANERTSGTWRRLLASPVPRWQALLGKLVPYYLISCAQLALLFGVGIAVFGMNVAGSPIALVAVSLSVSLCATCLGLLAASFGGTENQIGATLPAALLVMGLISGCMFPRLLMPDTMKQIGHAVPHSWALDAYYDVIVRAGTSLADVAPAIAALWGFSALFATLGIARFRFERAS